MPKHETWETRTTPGPATVRIRANPRGGRDFIVGDVHREFDALEALLTEFGFERDADRLFALGDPLDRGARNADAIEWIAESS